MAWHHSDSHHPLRSAHDWTSRGFSGSIGRLDALAERRLASNPHTDLPAVHGPDKFANLLRGRVRVRAASTPLVILLVRPTGAGKSTIFNTIRQRSASPTGVLRPNHTGRRGCSSPLDDRQALVEGAFAARVADQLRFVEDATVEQGPASSSTLPIKLRSSTPIGSSRTTSSRPLTCCCFVARAARYADRVPWAVLSR